MRISDDHQLADDVLVGDVWVSSGQSNMMMGLASISGGPQQTAGPGGVSGLAGGASPATEALQVKFPGAAERGDYTATLRIVTQASNIGRRSLGQPGEPAERFCYLDIPVVAHVGQ